MTILGIAAEYNPFHNGHAHHIREARRKSGADAVIVAMSQENVQRGAFAAFDTPFRVRAALEAGADLVVGLPYAAAGQSAEYFAGGAVRLLAACGANALAFGAEDAQSDALEAVADILADEPPAFKTALKDALAAGTHLARARQEAFDALYPELAPLLRTPNNTLAIEYLKAARREGLSLKTVPVTRAGSAYHDRALSAHFPSASAVRAALDGPPETLAGAVPYAPELLVAHRLIFDETGFFTALCARLLSGPPDAFSDIAGISEGLENRLARVPYTCTSLAEAYDFLKSKRVTHAGVRRTLMNVMLGFTQAELQAFTGMPPYATLLGFTPKGRALIRNIQAPVISRAGRDAKKLTPAQRRAFETDVRAANLAALFTGAPLNAVYRRVPVMTGTKIHTEIKQEQ